MTLLGQQAEHIRIQRDLISYARSRVRDLQRRQLEIINDTDYEFSHHLQSTNRDVSVRLNLWTRCVSEFSEILQELLDHHRFLLLSARDYLQPAA